MFAFLMTLLILLCVTLIIYTAWLVSTWKNVSRAIVGDRNEITEHIIQTRINFNLVFTSIGIAGILLVFMGYNQKAQFEREMKDSLSIMGGRIQAAVAESINVILRDIKTLDLQQVLSKRDSVSQILTDVDIDKRSFDAIIKRRIGWADSLRSEVRRGNGQMAYNYNKLAGQIHNLIFALRQKKLLDGTSFEH